MHMVGIFFICQQGTPMYKRFQHLTFSNSCAAQSKNNLKQIIQTLTFCNFTFYLKIDIALGRIILFLDS